MRNAFLSMLAIFSTTSAQASDICPGGQPAVVRVSKITPKGSMAGFREAMRDHASWYRGHGFAMTQFIAPVLVYSPKTRAQVVSDREVMTVRLGSADVPRDRHDAGWTAFVAKYKANSTIASETRVCFPKAI